MVAELEITAAEPLLESFGEAALHWYEFGLPVIPVNPETKSTAVRWKPWLNALNAEQIQSHWDQNPDHHVGWIVDQRWLVVDADNELQSDRLAQLEIHHGVSSSLIVKTSKGQHRYYRRAPKTFARMQSFSTINEPDKLDIRTGRTATEGWSMVVLPPSGGKVVQVCEVSHADDLSMVDQEFIDALWKLNGKEAPRKAAARPPVLNQQPPESTAHDAEILSHIDPNCGYGDWTEVLMGLHDKYDGNDDGLALARKWSIGGQDFPGDEEFECRWRSFTPGHGVTFASVALRAKEAGADLAAIARKYGKDGRPLPTFDQVLAMAKGLPDDGEGVEEVVHAAAHLSPVKKKRIHREIKNATGIPLGTLTEQDKADSEGGRAPDHLMLTRDFVATIGAENVLAAESFVWMWEGSGVWCRLEDRAVKQQVQSFIDGRVASVTKGVVDGVCDVFKTEVFKSRHEFNVGPPECVNVLNGELTLDSGRRAWILKQHQRDHYRTTQIPVEWNPDAEAPMFTRFLEQIFEGDADRLQKVQALLEMMGYTLMAHCNHERFVILVGGGANGKSVLLHVLEQLCGSANVAGVQPSEFGNKYQRAHLHGKLANIVTEVRQGAAIDDDALKGITSGELTTVEIKNKDPFDMRPFSTCWFGTNHLPHTRDFSDAMFRRALVVPFNRQFKPELGNCDPELKHKIVADELPGVLRMTLEAYAYALQHGFTMPASCAKARKEWRLEADQVAQFVEDVCEDDPEGREPFMQLYSTYEEWAKNHGVKRTVGSKTFRDRLTKLGYGKKKGHKARYVTGLKRNPEAEF